MPRISLTPSANYGFSKENRMNPVPVPSGIKVRASTDTPPSASRTFRTVIRKVYPIPSNPPTPRNAYNPRAGAPNARAGICISSLKMILKSLTNPNSIGSHNDSTAAHSLKPNRCRRSVPAGRNATGAAAQQQNLIKFPHSNEAFSSADNT